MADRKDEKKAAKAPVAKGGAGATAEKNRPAAKPAGAKKTVAKTAAPAKRAVARPVTRAVSRSAPVKEEKPGASRTGAPAPEAAAPAPKPKREPRPLPTAPVGEIPFIGVDGSVGSLPIPSALTEAKRRAGVLFQALATAASNAHLGTSATKNRARVAGGGAKPWRQKGTGRARQGSIRAPQWRHGGVAFGPNGRRYQRRIPEKMRREAFAEALAARHGDGRVLVYEGLEFEDDRPRTRTVVEWLGKLGDTGSVLFVTPEIDEPVARATANVPRTSIRSVGALRTSDLLTHDTLLVRRDALDALATRVGIAAGPRVGAGAA